MTLLFLDTSFLLALEDGDDQYHRAAHAYWRALQSKSSAFTTTSYVLDETLTLVRKRLSHRQAIILGKRLRASGLVEIVYMDEPLFEAAWRLFEDYDDKDFSFTDCVSFALMRQRKIKVALSFDRDFTQAGFERKP